MQLSIERNPLSALPAAPLTEVLALEQVCCACLFLPPLPGPSQEESCRGSDPAAWFGIHNSSISTQSSLLTLANLMFTVKLLETVNLFLPNSLFPDYVVNCASAHQIFLKIIHLWTSNFDFQEELPGVHITRQT